MSRGDPSAVSTGDLVRVELEAEVFQAVQEGRGGWSDIMLNVIKPFSLFTLARLSSF